MRAKHLPVGFGLFVGLCLMACAPLRVPPGPGPTTPRLEADRLVTGDGTELALRTWKPADNPGHRPKAVILALHGFNMHSGYFDEPAAWLAARAIAVYAYDQRGFGATPHAGLWAGTETLVEDLKTAVELIKRRHPETPFFLLGDSMGGAVVIAALTRPAPPEIAGAILSAPAVWARETMPFYQRAALWLGARLIPWASFTGEGLEIVASDNREALYALGRDPLVIKKTKVSAMEGLTDLMSEALEAAPRLRARAFLLYGAKDEIIPPQPTLRFWQDLPAQLAKPRRRALYAGGWHMLLRDLGAERVLADIEAWIEKPTAALPSGADQQALERLVILVNDDD